MQYLSNSYLINRSRRNKNKVLTESRKILLFLGIGSVSVDRMHDQGRLDAHGRPVATVHSNVGEGHMRIIEFMTKIVACDCRELILVQLKDYGAIIKKIGYAR